VLQTGEVSEAETQNRFSPCIIRMDICTVKIVTGSTGMEIKERVDWVVVVYACALVVKSL
jgi:hypothetical protein